MKESHKKVILDLVLIVSIYAMWRYTPNTTLNTIVLILMLLVGLYGVSQIGKL